MELREQVARRLLAEVRILRTWEQLSEVARAGFLERADEVIALVREAEES